MWMRNPATIRRVTRVIPFAFVALILVAPTSAQTIAAPTDKTIEVTPSQKWVDTGIDLHPGDLLQVSATTTGSGNQLCDPQGLTGLANTGKLPLESALPEPCSPSCKRNRRRRFSWAPSGT